MNGVSNIELAVAVANAGAMASLFLSTSLDNFIDALTTNIKIFKDRTNTENIVVCVPLAILRSDEAVKKIIDLNIKFIEPFPTSMDTITNMFSRGDDNMNSSDFIGSEWTDPIILHNVSMLKDHGVKTLYRVIWDNQPVPDVISALCLKGDESAGLRSSKSVKARFLEFSTGKIPLIPYGGISGPADVSYYLANGAVAVASGTLFAACKESPLSIETKNKMVYSTAKDLTLFKDSKQRALVFKEEIRQPMDLNSHDSLAKGIAGTGGHIYAGTSIDGVTEIRTAKQVVDYLVSDIVASKY